MPSTVTALTCCLSLSAAAADSSVTADLTSMLEPILKESKLPSLSAAVVVGDEIRGVGALGVRKLGDPTPVTKDDKYHIGSCTKMFTATLAAALIEDGLLIWETTIEDVLGERMKGIHEQYRDVTLEQLLAHVGGLPENCPRKIWAKAWKNQGKMKPVKQRMIFVSSLLTAKPAYQPGSKFEYSNQGYAVAGFMLETLAKKPWEQLVRERIFKPLGMDSAGFRAPSSAKVLDQPWGHAKKKPVAPEPGGDNPDAIGPAGTIHASISDWAKFARFHLQREPGTILKKAESFDKLHTTLPTSGVSGVGGWLIHDMPHLGGHVVQSAGSNTMWFALLWIIPAQDIAIVVATNSGQPNAFESCDKVVAALIPAFSE